MFWWISSENPVFLPCILLFVFGLVCIYISGTIFYPSDALLGHYSFTMNLYDQHVGGLLYRLYCIEYERDLDWHKCVAENTIIE